MAYLGQSFNAQNSTPVPDYEPLPEGWYTAEIKSAEVRDAKTGTGTYLNVKYQITGPTHAGRVVFGKITLKNISQKAENTGRGQIGGLRNALGIADLSDGDQLIGGVLEIKLTVKAAREGYSAENDVQKFRAIQGVASMPKAAVSATVTASPSGMPRFNKA